MCGRFSIIDDIDQICQRFNCPTAFDYWPRYNVLLPGGAGSYAGAGLQRVKSYVGVDSQLDPEGKRENLN